jgi:putative redox protein
MEYKLATDWTSGIAFESQVDGFTVSMDSADEGTSKGPSPKKLMLLSLLGCTGMDVVSLMQKMRVPFDHFRIESVAPLTEEHPKVFKSVHLTYIVTGQNIKREKVEKAINLSQERYCGVSIMLKKHSPVTWDLELIEKG